MTLTKDIFVLDNPAQCVCVCVCVSFPSLSDELTGHQTKKKKKKRKEEEKKNSSGPRHISPAAIHLHAQAVGMPLN